MKAVAEGATLDGAVRVLALLLVGYLVLGQPAFGAWSARRQHADRVPGARLRRYRRTTVLEWALTILALLLVATAPGLAYGDLGLRLPRASAYTVVGAVGLVVGLGTLVGLRRKVDRGADVVAPAEVAALLPRTVLERRWFAGVAVTAGMCEELLYRGLLLAVAVAVAPGLAPWRLVLVSALAFAVAHTYQGVVGMLTAGVLGGGFAVLFLGSGSLLLPVLLHMLIDLRLLVLAVRTPRHRGRGTAAGPPGSPVHARGPALSRYTRRRPGPPLADGTPPRPRPARGAAAVPTGTAAVPRGGPPADPAGGPGVSGLPGGRPRTR